MNVPILDLKRQYETIKDEVEAQILEVARSGYYIMGPQVAALEQELAEYLNVKHVITVANGTDAIVIALQACGVTFGDEVITTPFTFFATSEAISSIGAIPIFVDIEEGTLNIDPSKIEAKITPKTKAILPVHIFGQTADMDAINKIAQKHDLKVIEDACQAIGSKHGDKYAGALSDLACFSFFPTKNLGAFGDAGMITTNNDDLAIICRALREHAGGQNGANAKQILAGNKIEADSTEQNSIYNPNKYYNYLIGYNSRLDAIQAAVLRVKLKHLDTYNQKRRNNAQYYIDHLADVDIILPYQKEGTTHSWHQFVILSKKKDELSQFLADNGITTGAFYPVPLHLQKAYEGSIYKQGDHPVAELIATQSLCLPIFPELTAEELEYVVSKIKEFYNKS